MCFSYFWCFFCFSCSFCSCRYLAWTPHGSCSASPPDYSYYPRRRPTIRYFVAKLAAVSARSPRFKFTSRCQRPESLRFTWDCAEWPISLRRQSSLLYLYFDAFCLKPRPVGTDRRKMPQQRLHHLRKSFKSSELECICPARQPFYPSWSRRYRRQF